MKMVALGELCEVVIGRTPARANQGFWGVGEPWVAIKDLNQGRLVTHTKEQITPEAASACKRVEPGTVLLSFKLSIGKVAIAGMPLFTNEAIAALPVLQSERLDEGYLLRALEAMDLSGDSNRAAMGATLNKAALERIPVPLPPLDEQRRIAAILDHADALRAKRRQVLAHLDTLPQAIFHKMFAGGPWERVPLQEVSDGPGQYGASVSSTSHRPELPRYVRITDIDDSGSLNADARSPAGPPEGWERHGLHDGDFLFARSGATVGKAYRYRDEDGPCVYAGYLIRFRLRSDLIKPDFLMGFTRTEEYANWVAARQNVVAQPNINAKQYGQELLVPIPDPAHQEEYVNQAERVRQQAAKVKRAAIRDDDLFASLQSRAFRGEL